MQLLTISLVVLCVATYVYGQYGYGDYGGRWGSDVHDQMETREKSQYVYGAHHIHTGVFHEFPFGHKCELNFDMSSKYDVEKSNQISTGIDESKYICWCGFHVLSCAKFWSWFNIIVSAIHIFLLPLLLAIVGQIHMPILYKGDLFAIAFDLSQWIKADKIQLLSSVINILLSAISLYGIYKIKPSCLLPLIILLPIGIIVIGILTFYGIVLVIEEIEKLAVWPVDFIQNVGTQFLIDILLIMLLYVYYRAYRYLKEVELLKANSVYPMQSTQQPTTVSYQN